MRMLKLVKKLLSQREYINYWIKEFIKLIATMSILHQIHAQFRYLKDFREKNRRRFAVTLFAIDKVQLSVQSKGQSHEQRTLVESKMYA